MRANAEIDALRAEVDGSLLLDGDEGYDESRTIWNALFDRRPALIVRPRSAAGVASAVRFARRHDLEIAIKGGGHHAAGYAATSGGMLLDMSSMRSIMVDSESRTVRAGSGLTWAQFDQATQAFGLACTGPIVSMTGIAGFTLGGGMGWLHRKIGLGCDSLRGVALVTAEGETIAASERENPDLFWAMRGSGWNFGVVTSMEFEARAIGPMVTAGLIYFPLDDFPALVEKHCLLVPSFPDELTTWFFLRLAPPVPVIPVEWVGKPVVALAMCHCGSVDEGKRWAGEFSEGGRAIVNTVSAMEYRNWQRSLDGRWGSGFFNDWRGHYLDALSPTAVQILMEDTANLRSQWTDIKIPHLGGAVRRVPENATAFGNRDAEFAIVTQARWELADETAYWTDWSRRLRDALSPYATGGVYANFLAREEADRVPDAHGAGNYARLQELKGKYDPANVFRLNPNVRA